MSGLTSLGYQVVWNRLLGAGTGSSTYVFTIILALFLVGIAIGAVLLGFLRPRVRPTTLLIAAAQVLTAVFVIVGAAVLASPQTPFNGASPKFADALRDFAWSAAVIVLPPTIVMGLDVPGDGGAAGRRDGTEGSATGSLLAVNTGGSLVATFVLPFFVIPLIGSPATLAALADRQRRRGRRAVPRRGAGQAGRPRRSAPSAAAVVGVVVVTTLVRGTAFRQPTIELIQDHGGVVYDATEDEIAAVQAGKLGATPQIWVGGTSMTLITVDTKFMPLLPLALRPEATRGLTIAFGMGTAFRTALIAGVTTDAVELVPSVPEMFHWFYADADQVLANPDGARDHRGRPQPRGADQRDVRLHRRGPAAADRVVGRVGDLVARVLPRGEGAPRTPTA